MQTGNDKTKLVLFIRKLCLTITTKTKENRKTKKEKKKKIDKRN
jgi:hypothetical protein